MDFKPDYGCQKDLGELMKELLFSVTRKDLRIEYFCSGGPGGQHQNKTASGCRITHEASGAVGESREEREQSRNRANAFKRLTTSPKFISWLRVKASEMSMNETTKQAVERLTQPQFLKIETKDAKGRWKQTPESELSAE